MRKLDRASMLYGTLLLTATGLISQLLAFVYRIFLSRLVGAEVMGLYQLVMPVYSVLLSITAIGLTAAVSHLTSHYRALGNRRAALQVLYRCLGFFLLLLTLPALVVLLFSDQISVHILGDARTQLGLVMLLPCLLLTGVENLHKHAFYGAGLVRPPAFTELLEQLVRTVAVLGLLVVFLPQNSERTVGIIVLGMVICEIFSSVTLAILHRRRVGRTCPISDKGEDPKVLHRSILHVALPIGATALLGNLMGSICAVLIPQKLVAGGLSVTEAISSFGVLFGMTAPLLNLPTAFISALGLVLVPKLTQSVALHRSEEVRRHISKAMQATSILMLPALALLVVIGPTLGAILFREPTVGHYMAPLSLGMLLSCYQSVLHSSLNGVGQQASSARCALVSGAVELVIVFFTVGLPGVGLRGYVWALLISSVVGVIMAGCSLWRATGLRPQLFQWMTAPALSALLMGLCVNLLFQTLLSRGLGSLESTLTCLVFGTILYLSALAAQGFRLRSFFHIS